MIPVLGLLAGLAVGLFLDPSVPVWLQPYLPIAVIAALDAVFGAIRAILDGIFNDKVFVVSFLSNVVVAAFIVFLGDQLGVGVAALDRRRRRPRRPDLLQRRLHPPAPLQGLSMGKRKKVVAPARHRAAGEPVDVDDRPPSTPGRRARRAAAPERQGAEHRARAHRAASSPSRRGTEARTAGSPVSGPRPAATALDDDFTSPRRETRDEPGPVEGRAAWTRLLKMSRPRATRANLLGALLAVLLGAGIAAQVQLTNQRGLDELSQTDLVRVLDDISLRSSRLDQQVRELESTRDRLKSGTGTAGEALEQAQKRVDTLGILAGTLAAQGTGHHAARSATRPSR